MIKACWCYICLKLSVASKLFKVKPKQIYVKGYTWERQKPDSEGLVYICEDCYIKAYY